MVTSSRFGNRTQWIPVKPRAEDKMETRNQEDNCHKRSYRYRVARPRSVALPTNRIPLIKSKGLLLKRRHTTVTSTKLSIRTMTTWERTGLSTRRSRGLSEIWPDRLMDRDSQEWTHLRATSDMILRAQIIRRIFQLPSKVASRPLGIHRRAVPLMRRSHRPRQWRVGKLFLPATRLNRLSQWINVSKWTNKILLTGVRAEIMARAPCNNRPGMPSAPNKSKTFAPANKIAQ